MFPIKLQTNSTVFRQHLRDHGKCKVKYLPPTAELGQALTNELCRFNMCFIAIKSAKTEVSSNRKISSFDNFLMFPGIFRQGSSILLCFFFCKSKIVVCDTCKTAIRKEKSFAARF